jgi:type VII secretion integral membrane protein EccD
VTAGVVSNSCRLTIMSATTRVDLAVPVQISIAELLAVVLSSLGRDVADRGTAEGGWILQRDTDTPLDPSASLAASQLRDGDVLHLRTRASKLPEVAFDDVLDAVATGVRTRTARWQPVYTMRAAATGAAVLLTFALAVLLAAGPPWTTTAVCCGAGAGLLLLAAIAVGRVFARRGAALTAAAFAVAYAFACGATAVAEHHRLSAFGAPQTLVGACAALLVAAILLVTLGAGLAGFVAVMLIAALTAIGTGIATGTTLSPAGTAAIVATVALALSPVLPALAFRLSRLQLPAIPTDAADLRRDTATLDAPQILRQAERADQFLTGLIAGMALSLAGAAVIISAHGVSERVLAVVLGLICLLRARLFSGRGQRASLLISALVALTAVLVNAALSAPSAPSTTRVMTFAIPAAVVALVLFGLAVSLPGRRYSPPMSRAVDMLESVLVLSVIPLALAVMGVYGAIRGAVS